jgi:hypothetical protein
VVDAIVYSINWAILVASKHPAGHVSLKEGEALKLSDILQDHQKIKLYELGPHLGNIDPILQSSFKFHAHPDLESRLGRESLNPAVSPFDAKLLDLLLAKPLRNFPLHSPAVPKHLPHVTRDLQSQFYDLEVSLRHRYADDEQLCKAFNIGMAQYRG